LLSALRAGVLSSCFAKKKVAKEEGDPRVGAGYAGPLRNSLLAGAAELGLRPQTVLALFPPAAALLSASQGDPKGAPEPNAFRKTECYGRPEKKAKIKKANRPSSPEGLPGPLGGAEQRRKARKKGEDCLKGKAPSSAAPASAE